MKYLFFPKIIAWTVGLVLVFGTHSFEALAQTSSGGLGGQNTVFSAIPFLRINPDARTGAMGDVGLATSPDPSSIYANASKLAFAPNDLGLGITYTPWLRALVNDIYLAQVTGYKRINELQTLALSMRYFSLGNIEFTDFQGMSNGQHTPNEFAFDLAYARKLSDNFSAGITLKYVRSDLANGQEVSGSSGNIVKAASAVAADVSFYFEKDIEMFKIPTKVSFGTAITNIGNKVSYTEDDRKDFIPTNLGIGTAFAMDIDEHNSITLAFDMNKLMVPTPDTLDAESPLSNRNKALLSGIFGSFGDAPNGFSEEMQEIMYSVGFEYWYNKLFAVRLGYFHEHANKGNRKYVTAGVGVKYSVFGLNFSYIIPASSDGQNNPLNNTVRFSLVFDFENKNGGGEE